MNKAIIFDWRRTLFNNDEDIEFPEADDTLQYCQSRGYRMAAISLVSPKNRAKRVEEINNSPLRKYFELALVTDFDKNQLFEQAVKHFNIPRNEIFIIGDRVSDEIKYGNKYGHPTIWLKEGKFSSELPTEEIGKPTYVINELGNLKKIL